MARNESKKTTQLSPAHIFFWAAFSLGLKKLTFLGKPYDLFFGGLDACPWGVWWLCLLTAIGVSGLRKQTKVFAVLVAGLISYGVSYYVLAQEASLRIVEAPRLNLIYLFFVTLLSAVGFFEKRSWAPSFSLLVLLVLSLVSGIELSIVLRWLEGNT